MRLDGSPWKANMVSALAASGVLVLKIEGMARLAQIARPRSKTHTVQLRLSSICVRQIGHARAVTVDHFCAERGLQLLRKSLIRFDQGNAGGFLCQRHRQMPADLPGAYDDVQEEMGAAETATQSLTTGDPRRNPNVFNRPTGHPIISGNPRLDKSSSDLWMPHELSAQLAE